jgi:hypothetical protein
VRKPHGLINGIVPAQERKAEENRFASSAFRIKSTNHMNRDSLSPETCNAINPILKAAQRPWRIAFSGLDFQETG